MLLYYFLLLSHTYRDSQSRGSNTKLTFLEDESDTKAIPSLHIGEWSIEGTVCGDTTNTLSKTWSGDDVQSKDLCLDKCTKAQENKKGGCCEWQSKNDSVDYECRFKIKSQFVELYSNLNNTYATIVDPIGVSPCNKLCVGDHNYWMSDIEGCGNLSCKEENRMFCCKTCPRHFSFHFENDYLGAYQLLDGIYVQEDNSKKWILHNNKKIYQLDISKNNTIIETKSDFITEFKTILEYKRIMCPVELKKLNLVNKSQFIGVEVTIPCADEDFCEVLNFSSCTEYCNWFGFELCENIPTHNTRVCTNMQTVVGQKQSDLSSNKLWSKFRVHSSIGTPVPHTCMKCIELNYIWTQIGDSINFRCDPLCLDPTGYNCYYSGEDEKCEEYDYCYEAKTYELSGNHAGCREKEAFCNWNEKFGVCRPLQSCQDHRFPGRCKDDYRCTWHEETRICDSDKEEEEEEVEDVPDAPIIKVDGTKVGMWDEWFNWGKCSKSCDAGKRMKTRLCTNPLDRIDIWDDSFCKGDNTVTRTCMLRNCKVEVKSETQTTPKESKKQKSHNFISLAKKYYPFTIIVIIVICAWIIICCHEFVIWRKASSHNYWDKSYVTNNNKNKNKNSQNWWIKSYDNKNKNFDTTIQNKKNMKNGILEAIGKLKKKKITKIARGSPSVYEFNLKGSRNILDNDEQNNIINDDNNDNKYIKDNNEDIKDNDNSNNEQFKKTDTIPKKKKKGSR